MINKKHREEYIIENFRKLLSLQAEREKLEKTINNALTEWTPINKQIGVILKRLRRILK